MHHDRGVLDERPLLEILQDERGCHRIGKVRDPSARIVGQVGEGGVLGAQAGERLRNLGGHDLRGVAHHKGKTLGILGRHLAQGALHVGVGLDGDHGGSTRQERTGERAAARTDLEHRLRGSDVGKLEDVGDDGIVYQEVLSQLVLCLKPEGIEHGADRAAVCHLGHCHRVVPLSKSSVVLA